MRFKRSRVRQIRKNISVKKSSEVSEISTQSKLSMNRKNPSVRKYAVNQKCEMSTQEKQASYPESNVKHAVTTKGPRGLRNLENCYMHVIFQCLAEGTSSLRSSPCWEGMEKFERAGVGIAKVSTQYRRKGDTSSASKTCCQSRVATIC